MPSTAPVCRHGLQCARPTDVADCADAPGSELGSASGTGGVPEKGLDPRNHLLGQACEGSVEHQRRSPIGLSAKACEDFLKHRPTPADVRSSKSGGEDGPCNTACAAGHVAADTSTTSSGLRGLSLLRPGEVCHWQSRLAHRALQCADALRAAPPLVPRLLQLRRRELAAREHQAAAPAQSVRPHAGGPQRHARGPQRSLRLSGGTRLPALWFRKLCGA
mmetsp:Transcript_52256/g.169781  ORF Transcript_52256/g.169781 Transcript_52256/m.169781 type:complete len:219 (+) Transcript_52256:202-858(+)